VGDVTFSAGLGVGECQDNVGVAVGCKVGLAVVDEEFPVEFATDSVGAVVGICVGPAVAFCVGTTVGVCVGPTVGCVVGPLDAVAFADSVVLAVESVVLVVESVVLAVESVLLAVESVLLAVESVLFAVVGVCVGPTVGCEVGPLDAVAFAVALPETTMSVEFVELPNTSGLAVGLSVETTRPFSATARAKRTRRHIFSSV